MTNSTLSTARKVERVIAEKTPIFYTIREWCGASAATDFTEIAELRKEIQRLQGVVDSFHYWLGNNGHKGMARSLLARFVDVSSVITCS